jgi:GNAT superfamily N-acetyltransferase
MPRHCTPVLPWRDSMRVVRWCSSGDLDSVDLPESVRFALAAFLSIPAAERFALLVDARNTSSDTAAVANGVVLLQLQTFPDSLRQAATIHAIGVREHAQDKGIASALLMRAVDLAVQHGVHDSMPGGSPLACSRAESYVEFFLARGSCLHHWDVMLLLCNHGWCIRRHGQSPSHTSELSPSDIRHYRAEGMSPTLLALTVRGPLISLDGPLLYPGVESGRGLFKAPIELPPPPAAHSAGMRRTRDRWDCSHNINSAILRGTLPLSQLSATYPLPGTGLLPFTAPLLECQKLESYLEDRRNHEYGVDLGSDGENIFKHTLFCPLGQPLMKGYHQYGTLHAKHDPALQSARTLKTYSKKSIKAMIEGLPGCAGILQAAMARLWAMAI